MNKVSKTVALLAALSLASAYAATNPTTAGTAIGNQASATFSDASGNNPTTVTSNPVITTVSAVPSFTVLLNGQNSTGTPGVNGAGLTPAGTVAAVPGQQVSFKYTITNTGNVTQDNYALVAQTSYSATSGAAPASPVYYTTDGSGNCTTTVATTSGPLDPNQSATFCVVYSVPAGAKTGDQLGTDAIVALTPHTITSASYTAPDGTVVSGTTVTETAPANDTDNWNQAQVTRTDAGLVGPNTDADADGKLDPANTAPVTPYTQNGVTINYNGDSQNAQATSTTTSITFLNTVKNTGNRADTFNLSAALTNVPAGATGVSITDTSGTAITNTGSLAAGAEYTFRVVVSFPAGSAPTGASTPFTATVTSTSQNSLPANGGAGAQSDTTTDVVNLPGVTFTDSVNGTPTPAAPNNSVTTTGATTGTTPTTYPMVVVNNGTTPDSFNFTTNNVTVNTPTGTASAVVTYYVDANCDGVADNATPITSTGTLAAGAKACVVASVAVPQNTLPGTYTLTQTATSPTTGASSTDNNDQFTVQKTTASFKPVKTVDKATAAPGDTLTYTITGSNTNNANITSYILSDTVPTNTSFVSVAATITDANSYGTTGYKVLYRVGTTGSWSATAPTTAADGATIQVAIDANNDGLINSSDVLKPGQGISETFKVKVK